MVQILAALLPDFALIALGGVLARMIPEAGWAAIDRLNFWVLFPALIFVAYGIATVASMIIVTPNGVGAYEVVLIATLVAGGMVAGPTTAAIVMARTILLIGTIVFGWGFYQHSVATAGAPPVRRGATPLPDGR